MRDEPLADKTMTADFRSASEGSVCFRAAEPTCCQLQLKKQVMSESEDLQIFNVSNGRNVRSSILKLQQSFSDDEASNTSASVFKP